MQSEKKLDELIRLIKTEREQNARQSKIDRLENLSFISWGFALAMVSLGADGLSKPYTNWKITAAVVSIVGAVFFSIFGFMANRKRLGYIPQWKRKNLKKYFWDI